MGLRHDKHGIVAQGCSECMLLRMELLPLPNCNTVMHGRLCKHEILQSLLQLPDAYVLNGSRVWGGLMWSVLLHAFSQVGGMKGTLIDTGLNNRLSSMTACSAWVLRSLADMPCSDS